MTRYRPWRDPACVIATGLYGVNRWLILPHLGPGLWHDHFSDLWCIPAALPWVLWIHGLLGWRRAELPPAPGEVLFHWAVWSLVAELAAPRWIGWGTGDARDVLAYAAGAVGAGIGWHRMTRMQARTG